MTSRGVNATRDARLVHGRANRGTKDGEAHVLQVEDLSCAAGSGAQTPHRCLDARVGWGMPPTHHGALDRRGGRSLSGQVQTFDPAAAA